jgi:D-3-phosphoglycerate dehydrogenase/C-terminal binding protein
VNDKDVESLSPRFLLARNGVNRYAMRMAKFNVFVTDLLKPPADVEQRVLRNVAKVTLLGCDHESKLPDDIRRADGILVWHEVNLGAKTIARLDRCKVIGRCGVGVDNIDLKAAGKRGIVVTNVPDYGTNEVADHAIALLLALTRGITQHNEAVRDRGSWAWRGVQPLFRLTGRTIGIVGLGRIGTATAKRAASLGLRVLFYDPYLPDGVDKAHQYDRAWKLEDLLKRSDIVSLHTPLTSETRHMLNDKTLRLVKRGCVIVNTARGPVIDLKALHRALLNGRVAAAGLDVTEVEPPTDAEPLIREWRSGRSDLRDRLIITPHAAFYSEEAFVEMREKAALEVRRVLTGEKPRNCVNRHWLR